MGSIAPKQRLKLGITNFLGKWWAMICSKNEEMEIFRPYGSISWQGSRFDPSIRFWTNLAMSSMRGTFEALHDSEDSESSPSNIVPLYVKGLLSFFSHLLLMIFHKWIYFFSFGLRFSLISYLAFSKSPWRNLMGALSPSTRWKTFTSGEKNKQNAQCPKIYWNQQILATYEYKFKISYYDHIRANLDKVNC